VQCILTGYGFPANAAETVLNASGDAGALTPEALIHLAEQVGLTARFAPVPVEHLAAPQLLPFPAVLPASSHEHEAERLLVLWQRLGLWVQVLDTAQGVRWLRASQLATETVYAAMPITLQQWHAAATSPPWVTFWQQRLRNAGFTPTQAADIIARMQADAGWYPLAVLDAAIRMVDRLIDGGALRRGSSACTTLQQLVAGALADGYEQQQVIPAEYWMVVPAPEDAHAAASAAPAEPSLQFRGTWLVEVGAPEAPMSTPAPPEPRESATPPEAAAEEAAPASPAATAPPTLVSFLRLEGLVRLSVLGTALLFAAAAVVLQALLLRSAMTLGVLFPAPQQHMLLIGSLVLFVLLLLLIEWHINDTVARIGRRLDARLRMAVLQRLPALSTPLLQRHTTADQMERIHAARDLHNVPEFGTRLLRTGLLLLCTLLGIAWIDALSALFGVLIVSSTLGVFWASVSLLATLNLDTRMHLGRLMRFYLDSMLGLVTLQVHSAERMMRRVYDRSLATWIGSMLTLARAEFWFVALEQTLSHLLIALTIVLFVVRGGSTVELPLLLFWLLQLALLGRDFARNLFRYLNEQSKCTRFTDLLQEYTTPTPPPPAAPADALSPPLPDAAAGDTPPHGAALQFSHVTVQAGASTILDDITVRIAAGSKVAIVGPSGAGKSTLVGLLLGQHQLATGTIALDGQPLTPERLTHLRQHTAWVDPLVQLWNRSLLYNLAYGGERLPLAQVLDQADVRPIIGYLPDGMQTLLGERGRLVSGGQGQRVRLGRSMQRPDARLVILDEPFRGLAHDQRATLLERARQFWGSATMLCVTHDVGHTTTFERVLVVEQGRIVEDGAPAELLERPDSHYRALLEAEQVVREHLWAGRDVAWRSLWLEGGSVQELAPEQPTTHSEQREAPPLQGSSGAPAAPPAAAPTPTPHAADDMADNALTWERGDVDEAVRALAYASGLRVQQPAPHPTREELPRMQPLAQQIEAAASRLHLDVEPLDVSYGALGQVLQHGGPALLQLASGRLLLLLPGSTPWWATILAPNLKRQRIKPTRLHDLICLPLHTPHIPHIEATLEHLDVPPNKQERARRVLLRERLHDATIGGVWLLRLSPGAPVRQQVRQAGLLRYLLLAMGGELMTSLLYVAVFGVLVSTAAGGQVAWGWLAAALLLLLMRAPAEMARWLGERFLAVGLRDIIKRRLFHGVLRLVPDQVQQHGTGQFLGWVMESERLEQAAQAVPFLLSTLVGLGVCAGLLAVGAGGPLHSLLLLLWLLLMGMTGRGSLRAYLHQRLYHHQITRDLLERMEGHQTRLVQEEPGRWHEEEDQELAHYHTLSRHDDHYRTLLAVLVPYGWLAVSLAALVPAFMLQPGAWLQLGSSFLGILLAFQLLRASLTDFFDLIRALGARQMLKPIETAAAQPPDIRPCPHALAAQQPPEQPLLEVQRVRFAYPHQEHPTLTDCTLRISSGNRLLLMGPSGGGKSTLAALLAGRRSPQAGMLLLYGLDWQTLGAACWRQHVVVAPQFHENHIIDASLAFNLLLGRCWPPHAEDIAAAEALCRELGLGALIDRMPGGIYEHIGETGWQVSHGERSRIYIARALLQGASLTILDESFGALDPHSMQVALRCALHHAPTLLVIAHP
jgi:ATP-binding cassette subfamily B protein